MSHNVFLEKMSSAVLKALEVSPPRTHPSGDSRKQTAAHVQDEICLKTGR
jgi:hypothetical protein